MNAAVEYVSNRASAEQIAEHLRRCDASFVPPLSLRVDLDQYARKIALKATTFEAWSDSTLVGLVAAYSNNEGRRIAFITNVSVLPGWTGQGIARRLLEQCAAHATSLGLLEVTLEVSPANRAAVRLYEKCGFIVNASTAAAPVLEMALNLAAAVAAPE